MTPRPRPKAVNSTAGPAASGRLSPTDFEDFHVALHGYPPFAWQTELLHQVDAERRWPKLIDLPTGAGKTTALDIAVFALALDAQRPPAERWAPRRIILVVDRRIVVDQAHQRAQLLANALNGAADLPIGNSAPVLTHMANALASFGELSGTGIVDAPPLLAGVLRGGLATDNQWALRPDVPAVLSSTVDQVGSRLLFRGYGVSPRSAPIHAGLMGNDTLFLLDEVHLSQPFAQTLSALTRLSPIGDGLPTRTQVVQLSATPGALPGVRFPASPLRAESTDDPLATRLRARKPTELIAVTTAKDAAKADAQFAKAVAKRATATLKATEHRLVGVVVNRVDTARRIAAVLRESTRGAEAPDVVLLTGRMRPVDRDRLLAEHSMAWTQRAGRFERPTQVVVATQCIEAGADFDFDCMISECASIDALRQRFGRVDRRGELAAADNHSTNTVMLRGERPPDDDPIYGPALAATWAWLCHLDPVDFGLERLPEAPDGCVAQKPDAPVLTPLHLRAFAQTSPIPTPDHVVARWLHGDTPTSPAVSVLWRDELNDLAHLLGPRQEGHLDEASSEVVATERDVLLLTETETEATERIRFCIPMGIEALEIPLHAARSWLAGATPSPVADVEGMTEAEDIPQGEPGLHPVAFVVWRDRAAHHVTPNALRPGDTVILPTAAGGLGASNNWDPGATEPIADVSVESSRTMRGREIVKLGPWLRPEPTGDEPNTHDPQRPAERRLYLAISEAIRTNREETTEELARKSIGALDDEPLASWYSASAVQLVSTTGASSHSNMPWDGFVGLSRTLSGAGVAMVGSGGPGDDASFLGTPAYLDEHLLAVGELASRFARNLGVSEALVNDLGVAGQLHDLGKHDPRFQRWLADGLAAPERPLAKSARPAWQWDRVRKARDAAAYPAGGRHELLSLTLAQSGNLLSAAHDPDLVAHLVTSHHGFARPFAPAVVDERPVGVEAVHLDTTLQAVSETGLPAAGSGLAARFDRLLDTYGVVGLAWLEAMFRLADHRRSQLESTGKGATHAR